MNDIDCILVGILAERDDLPPDRELVTFVNSIGEIQFALKIISDGPESLNLDKTITCYANKFRDYEFEDNYYEDWPVRARNFEAFLMDKLVLFRPAEHRKKGETLYAAEPLMVLPKPLGINNDSRLIPMLYLNQKGDEDYEALIVKQSPLGPFRYYPLQMPKVDPIYVYVNGYLYGSFQNRAERQKKWIFEVGEEIRRVPYDLLEQESIITFGEVAFVESYTYFKDFQAMLDSEGELIAQKPFLVPKAEQKDDNSLTQNEESESGAGDTGVSAATERSSQPAGNKDEVKFIYRLDRLCRASGLLYDEDDLLNFHTALKVGGLVILAGMSGTGKSHLVRMYAEALGLNDNMNNGRFKFLPVRPNWVDDTDLIGFLDTANNIYRPADTGIVNLLLEAEKHPDRLYLFCLDEMNLARVEHYFGQFLSVLELPLKNRSLQLYNPELKDRIYNSSQYPPQIKLGSNVLFVGTVNIDESTYTFSDKVLNRANILRLKVLPFDKLKEGLTGEPCEEMEYEVTTGQFLQWVNYGDKGLALNNSEIEFLFEMHCNINAADAGKGISYRMLRHIDKYLLNIPRNQHGPLLTRAKAFDFLLLQKVFPMLRGPQEQLVKLFGRYNDTTDDVEGSELLNLMDKYESISDFTSSRAEIKQKAKELRWFGYAS